MHAAFLLIALGFGYKIFAEASEKSKKSLKQLGRFIGVVIMIASALGTACTIFCAASGKMNCMHGDKSCYLGKRAKHADFDEGGMYGKKDEMGGSKKMMCPMFGDKTEKPSEKPVESK